MDTSEDCGGPGAHGAALPPPPLLLAALEACPCGVLLVGAGEHHPVALYANPAFQRMTGGQAQGQLGQVFARSSAARAKHAIRGVFAHLRPDQIALSDPRGGAPFTLTISAPTDGGDGSLHLLCYLTGGDALTGPGPNGVFLGGNGGALPLPGHLPDPGERNGALELALREALANDWLELTYQARADLRDGSIAAVKALVVLRHPGLGAVRADRLAALAEQTGLSGPIGAWALERAGADLAAWRDAGLTLPRLAIAMSLSQLRDPGLPTLVAQSLAARGLAPAQLAVEVTEASLLADQAACNHTLGSLKALGVGLTLDRFQMRLASLDELSSLGLDLVKIDPELTAGINDAADHAAMVKSIIAMAHKLGIGVVAVRVDHDAECDFLRRNMCDQIQGEVFAPALGADELAGLLARGHTLPTHHRRIQDRRRTLLLVDDEPNIVSSLRRLLRPDGYQILTANSGAEGLEVLAANAVDVIVSDQRMPGMIGADFLRAAKTLYPDTIRIMLSGYTELQSVTDAVNEGAIYKFLTKPWDDERLRGHIAEAFRLKEIADDNERLNLELRTANYDMAVTNRKMEELLRQKQQQISRDETSLSVAREILQHLPLPVIGLDDEGVVVFLNGAASRLFSQGGAMLGNEAPQVMPELFPNGWDSKLSHEAAIGQERYRVLAHPMGEHSASRGTLITLSRCEEV